MKKSKPGKKAQEAMEIVFKMHMEGYKNPVVYAERLRDYLKTIHLETPCVPASKKGATKEMSDGEEAEYFAMFAELEPDTYVVQLSWLIDFAARNGKLLEVAKGMVKGAEKAKKGSPPTKFLIHVVAAMQCALKHMESTNELPTKAMVRDATIAYLISKKRKHILHADEKERWREVFLAADLQHLPRSVKKGKVNKHGEESRTVRMKKSKIRTGFHGTAKPDK